MGRYARVGEGAVSAWDEDAWDAQRQEDMAWWEIVMEDDFVDFEQIQQVMGPMYAMWLEDLYA